MASKISTLGFLGSGHMATAMVRGFITAGKLKKLHDCTSVSGLHGLYSIHSRHRASANEPFTCAFCALHFLADLSGFVRADNITASASKETSSTLRRMKVRFYTEEKFGY